MKYTKTITVIDWEKVPNGSFFTATIKGKKATGRINKEANGKIRLVQNSKQGKSTSSQMYGFKYAWGAERGLPSELKQFHVNNLTIIDKAPKGFKVPVPEIMIGGSNVVFNKGNIQVGCTTVDNATVKEVTKRLK